MNQQRNINADLSANAKQKTQKQTPKYKPFPCPCGGGQSCIVHRRIVGHWVHEDDVFRKANLPIRKNCYTALSQEQLKAMEPYFPTK